MNGSGNYFQTILLLLLLYSRKLSSIFLFFSFFFDNNVTRLRYHLSFDHCTKTGTWILSSLPFFSSPFKDVNFIDVNFIRTERIPWNSFSLEFRVVANRFTDGVAKSRVYSSNATVTVLKLNDATAGKTRWGRGGGE